MLSIEEPEVVRVSFDLTADMVLQVEKAAGMFNMSQSEIVCQAVHEFLQKHGLKQTIESNPWV